MRVYLVQHGESKPEEEDPQRRLTAKGIDEVQNSGLKKSEMTNRSYQKLSSQKKKKARTEGTEDY